MHHVRQHRGAAWTGRIPRASEGSRRTRKVGEERHVRVGVSGPDRELRPDVAELLREAHFRHDVPAVLDPPSEPHLPSEKKRLGAGQVQEHVVVRDSGGLRRPSVQERGKGPGGRRAAHVSVKLPRKGRVSRSRHAETREPHAPGEGTGERQRTDGALRGAKRRISRRGACTEVRLWKGVGWTQERTTLAPRECPVKRTRALGPE